uniref:Uncharacterized protein n=1 Tax=Schlesneria paludicola TaxID=360056 RepID=A0A7C4QQL5_9PLAN
MEVAPIVPFGLLAVSLVLLLVIGAAAIVMAHWLLRQSAPGLRWVAVPMVIVAGAGALVLLFGGLYVVRLQPDQAAIVEQPFFATPAEPRSSAADSEWLRSPQSPRSLPAELAAESAVPTPPSATATDASVFPSPLVGGSDPAATDDRSQVQNAQAGAPDWVRAGSERRGEANYLVCASRQFSTVEEADADAKACLRELLLAEFRKVQASGVIRRPAVLDISRLIDGSVQDRYVETVQRDFGTFFAPMHRVWLRAEFSPAVHEALHAAHITAVQQGRLLVAGVVWAALLCLPLGVVSYGQLCRWVNCRRSRLLQAIVGTGVVGAWVAGFVLLQRLVIW